MVRKLKLGHNCGLKRVSLVKVRVRIWELAIIDSRFRKNTPANE